MKVFTPSLAPKAHFRNTSGLSIISPTDFSELKYREWESMTENKLRDLITDYFTPNKTSSQIERLSPSQLQSIATAYHFIVQNHKPYTPIDSTHDLADLVKTS